MAAPVAISPGTRVRVRALRPIGSAARLNGLTGTVVSEHSIARGWVVIELDPNNRVSDPEWPIAIDCLEPLGTPLTPEDWFEW